MKFNNACKIEQYIRFCWIIYKKLTAEDNELMKYLDVKEDKKSNRATSWISFLSLGITASQHSWDEQMFCLKWWWVSKSLLKHKTNMMRPSQNFLLYNGTILKIKVNDWINK